MMRLALLVCAIWGCCVGDEIKKEYSDKGVELASSGTRSSSELAGLGEVFMITVDSFQAFNKKLANVTLIMFDTQEQDSNWHLKSAFMNTARDTRRAATRTTFAFVDVGTDDGKMLMGAYQQKEAGDKLSYPTILVVVPGQHPVRLPLKDELLTDYTGAALGSAIWPLLLAPITHTHDQGPDQLDQYRQRINGSYLCRVSVTDAAQTRMVSKVAIAIKRQTILQPILFVNDSSLEGVQQGRAVIEYIAKHGVSTAGKSDA
jgi:hypothetical protein